MTVSKCKNELGKNELEKLEKNEHRNADVVDASTQFCMLVKSQLSLTETRQTIEVWVAEGGKEIGGERERARKIERKRERQENARQAGYSNFRD